MVTFSSNYKQAVPVSAGARDGSLYLLPSVAVTTYQSHERWGHFIWEKMGQIMFTMWNGSLFPKNLPEKSWHATANFIWTILERTMTMCYCYWNRLEVQEMELIKKKFKGFLRKNCKNGGTDQSSNLSNYSLVVIFGIQICF